MPKSYYTKLDCNQCGPSDSLTVVIKLGVSSVINKVTQQTCLANLSTLVRTATKLRQDGHNVIICSPEAMNMAAHDVSPNYNPDHAPQMQALAAIGQCRIISIWSELFTHLRQPIAQILLSKSDVATQAQCLKMRSTFQELLRLGVIPIVSKSPIETDSNVSDPMYGPHFSDDALSATIACLMRADYLFLMANVDCLYDKDPQDFADAKPITLVETVKEVQLSALESSGIVTKLLAARIATQAGSTAIITGNAGLGSIADIVRHAEAERVAGSGYSSGKASLLGVKNKSAVGEPARGMLTGIDALAASEGTSGVLPLHTRFLPSLEFSGEAFVWSCLTLAVHGSSKSNPTYQLGFDEHIGLRVKHPADEGQQHRQRDSKLMALVTGTWVIPFALEGKAYGAMRAMLRWVRSLGIQASLV